MFIIFDKEIFKIIIDIKSKIDKNKTRILFYDFLDLLSFLVWRDKIYLNNIYWIKIWRKNYKYLITRYWIDWNNIDDIDINRFIQIRFKNLFKIISYDIIKKIAVRWRKQQWNICIWEDKNLNDINNKIVLIQRRFIVQHLPQINYLCYMMYSEKIYTQNILKQKFNDNTFLKKIYNYERNEKKIYYANIIQKIWKEKYKYIHLKKCPDLKISI